jgi:hypothetical protein
LLASRLLHDPSFANPLGVTATHVAVVLGVGYTVFAFLALVTLTAFVVWFLARVEARRSGAYAAGPALDAALGASLLQVMLWVLISTALGWFVLYKFLPQYETMLRTVVAGLTLKLGVAAVIALCAAAVWVWRRMKTKAALAEQGDLPRLIVNPLVMYALIGLTLLSVLLFADAFLAGTLQQHDKLEPFTRYAEWIVIGGVALPFILKDLRNALHVLIDVTSHFHRRRLNPRQRKIIPHEFSIQQRIEGRLRRVLQEVLQSGEVTHLTVIAHSQGTVIALDVLWLEWAYNLLAGKTVYLVTMGSPISHLYQHYFPDRYPPLFANGRLNPDWGRHLDQTIQEWGNIYRIDDFIGTWVRGNAAGRFPVNHPPLGAGGHTRYWNELDVLNLMAPYLP